MSKYESQTKDKEPASEENKQVDAGGKGVEATVLKSGYTGIIFLFVGELWVCMPGLFLVFLLVCLLCVILEKNQVIISFLRAEENMGGENKTNGNANQVDEERNRTASIF